MTTSLVLATLVDALSDFAIEKKCRNSCDLYGCAACGSSEVNVIVVLGTRRAAHAVLSSAGPPRQSGVLN